MISFAAGFVCGLLGCAAGAFLGLYLALSYGGDDDDTDD